MSEQNLELVRGYFAAVDEVLLARKADPTAPLEAGADLLFEQFLAPDAEWSPPFHPEGYRGRDGWIRAAKDWLEVADGWKVEVEDLLEGEGDRVLAFLRVFIQGKGSGAAYEQLVYTVVTLAGGRITGVLDLSEQGEAREAAGLPPAPGTA